MSDRSSGASAPSSLQQQRKLAKDLLKAARAGDADAMARLGGGGAKLADAQRVIAREAGFDSWAKLVAQLETAELKEFVSALKSGGAATVRKLLASSPSVRRKINSPIGDFGGRPINIAAQHREVLDVLIDHGADINLRSNWDNGPFGVLDYAPEQVARHLLSRGAMLTAHAAARLGWFDELRRLVEANPAVVHERGGDGKQPLHFASTVQIADYLLDHGAGIEVRCIDHHSTPAQYVLDEHPDVCRRLLARGASADIYMPARLGDVDLARRLIDEDPSCVSARINLPGYAPVALFNIYCWTLGFYRSPHEIALKFNNREVYDLLIQHSPPPVLLLDAVSRGDEPEARRILARSSGLMASLSSSQQSLIAHAAFHNQTDAVHLMLDLGFDPMARGQDGGSALHCAAWVGNAEIVEMLLRHKVDLHLKDPTHGGTPLGWARHGAENCGRKADHARVIELLTAAGAS